MAIVLLVAATTFFYWIHQTATMTSLQTRVVQRSDFLTLIPDFLQRQRFDVAERQTTKRQTTDIQPKLVTAVSSKEPRFQRGSFEKNTATRISEFSYFSTPICSENGKNDRYFFYNCDDLCGGWADRVKGIVIAYVIAGLTNRCFGIQMGALPCDLKSFIQPNEVPWNITLSQSDRAAAESANKLDSVGFYNSLAKENLDEMFKARIVLFKGNLDYFEKIKENPHYREQLAWMQPLTRDQIFAKIYRKLFRFAPAVQKGFDDTLRKVKEKDGDRLVCAHLRMAANAENFRDTIRRHTAEHGDTVLQFLRQFDSSGTSEKDSEFSGNLQQSVANKDDSVKANNVSESGKFPVIQRFDENFNSVRHRNVSSPDAELHAGRESASPNLKYDAEFNTERNGKIPASSNVRFFVTSDSAGFVQKAAAMFGDRFVKTSGDVIHIDRNKAKACDGFSKVLVDQELLVHCDVLVISMSGLSRQAAYRRGTSEGLYCMLMNGTLVKCPPSRLKELYKIRG